MDLLRVSTVSPTQDFWQQGLPPSCHVNLMGQAKRHLYPEILLDCAIACYRRMPKPNKTNL